MTINEELALLEYGEPYQPGVPISSDGLDQADNQQLLWGYPGILWIARDVVIFADTIEILVTLLTVYGIIEEIELVSEVTWDIELVSEVAREIKLNSYVDG